MKLYGRELRDYDDSDLEALLNKLSVEELEELDNAFDPDVSGNFLRFFSRGGELGPGFDRITASWVTVTNQAATVSSNFVIY